MNSKLFISPDTGQALSFDEDKSVLSSAGNHERYEVIEKRLVSFLKEPDSFYEGAYLNRIKYIPKKDRFPYNMPIWLISNGYLWAVRKQIKPGATVLELGCASGIDYFAKRYQMIGLDLSITSLRGLNGYRFGIQADAAQLPLADRSVDAVVSSYFWEHIPAEIKDKMLIEFNRVLKPGGKLVFLYDVATENTLIGALKKYDLALYNQLFIDKDGHLGYETPLQNKRRFEAQGFSVVQHFGMERSWIQSQSVYEKFSHLPGLLGLIGKIGNLSARSSLLTYLHIGFVRIIDLSIGRLFNLKKSRIILSTAIKSQL